MRLFIALLLSPEIRERLAATTELLRKNSFSGNFTRPENFHLTLAFIGETERVAEICALMNRIAFSSFKLSVAGAGKFSRSEGDLWWGGVERSSELLYLRASVVSALENRGFHIDARPFSPHLTLGRTVNLSDNFSPDALEEALGRLSMTVSEVSLMKSENIAGCLTYTELYRITAP